jgi:hypothetical protein
VAALPTVSLCRFCQQAPLPGGFTELRSRIKRLSLVGLCFRFLGFARYSSAFFDIAATWVWRIGYSASLCGSTPAHALNDPEHQVGCIGVANLGAVEVVLPKGRSSGTILSGE